jgi:hypothetical protein
MNRNTSTLRVFSLLAGSVAVLAGLALFVSGVRADDLTREGQLANARILSQAATSLFTYAHATDSLARPLSADARATTEDAAFRESRRLVWYVSALEASATPAEVDEFAGLQQMVTVYRELHERVASAARSGQLASATHDAEIAGGVAQEISANLQRIMSRGYDALETASVPAISPARVATAE